jgi:prepilin-type N-terminal cleavage/methylation domain-containing protein
LQQAIREQVLNLLTRLLLSSHREQKDKQTMKIRTTSKGGFTLVEIMIVVAIIGLLAAIAIPNFVRARTQSQKNACINNLRQIDGATQTWALEQKKAPDSAVDYTDISPYLKNAVVCPSGGTAFSDSYTLTEVTNVPTCQKVTDHVLPAQPTG